MQLNNVNELIEKLGGNRVINKILIANNGLAAVKCMTSIRSWCYSTFFNERLIYFVAMVTPEDLHANAEYIKMADQSISVPGGSNNNNYANVELIVNIAVSNQVDAVWAGWGHASENPNLPYMLSKQGIVFLGPTDRAMKTLGDKVSSLIVAQSVDVPTLPWSGSGVTAPLSDASSAMDISKDLCDQACVLTAENGLALSSRIGYPVMIKASRGGGGKGIRQVNSEEQFRNHFRQVQCEVPGSPIFIMKVANNVRHLEVQILADSYGNAIALFGRDCSIQRRYQKVIEESPIVIAASDVCKQMENAALRLAKIVGYVSVGTVEFLYDPDGHFYFLELNPRLQVEHPCTEIIANVNLLSCQLQIGMGIPLHNIKDIRLMYGESAWSSSLIEFTDPRRKTPPKCHVIAARITAENPDDGFRPNSGTVKALNFISNENVWGYFSVSASGALHEFSDTQFGHCFSSGTSRQEARCNLIHALRNFSIRAEFRTNVEYLIEILETEDYQSNVIDTAWLDRMISKRTELHKSNYIMGIYAAAVHIARSQFSKTLADIEETLRKGHTPAISSTINEAEVDLIHNEMRFILLVSRTGPNSFNLHMNDSHKVIEGYDLSDGGLLLGIDRKSYTTYMREEISLYHIEIDKKTWVFEKQTNPSELRSPTTGKLVNLLVENDSHVIANQEYAEIEVMKMIMTLSAAESGTVNFVKKPGCALEAGEIIGHIDLDDASLVKTAQPYTWAFPVEARAELKPNLIQTNTRLRLTLHNYLDGYFPSKISQEDMMIAIAEYMMTLRDASLPLLKLKEIKDSLDGHIPVEVETGIRTLMNNYERSISSVSVKFPCQEIAKIIDRHAAALTIRSVREKFLHETKDIVLLVHQYRNGLRGYMRMSIQELLNNYYEIESQFESGDFAQCVSTIQKHNQNNHAATIRSIFSHKELTNKSMLIITLLQHLQAHETGLTKDLAGDLNRLTLLCCSVVSEHTRVALKANQLLLAVHQPSYEIRHRQLESILIRAVHSYEHDHNPQNLRKLVLSELPIFDVLPDFFYHPSADVRNAALEVYVRRSHVSFRFQFFKVIKAFQSHSDVSTVYFEYSVFGSQSKRLPCKTLNKGWTMSFLTTVDFQKYVGRIWELVDKQNKSHDPTVNHTNSSLKYSKTCCYIAIRCATNCEEHSNHSTFFESYCKTHKEQLVALGISRLTFIVWTRKNSPQYYTYRAMIGFAEDIPYRDIDPASAYELELKRMKMFNLEKKPAQNKKIHIYLATPKVFGKQPDRKFIVRIIARHTDLLNKVASFEYLQRHVLRTLIEAMNELEEKLSSDNGLAKCNIVFVNFIATICMTVSEIAELVSGFIRPSFSARQSKLGIHQIELKFKSKPFFKENPANVRIYITTTAGQQTNLSVYTEQENADGLIHLVASGKDEGGLHGQAIDAPYATEDYLQEKRFRAQLNGTTYAYDIPDQFCRMAEKHWIEFSVSRTNQTVNIPQEVLIDQSELVLNGRILEEAHRPPGLNNCAMVAWKMCIRTPEYPAGREFILIANDVTTLVGSFGPDEYYLFDSASKLARQKGIPRIYIACNSGARIGIAEEIKPLFRIAWEDAEAVEKGFKYLFLTPEDYEAVKDQNSVRVQMVEENGEKRYKITDIIGAQDGIGVENLRYAGMIAAETSLAYEEIVTISMVSCRAIGIGSYLLRLGQRVLQINNSHIILTGYAALNKVLGREVYSSNNQLGGTQIMSNNGVTHAIEDKDEDGVYTILQWLSYMPSTNTAEIPCTDPYDPVDRHIEFVPTKAPYDPRLMLEGYMCPQANKCKNGLFDRDSWSEIMQSWAQTVVVGRARLGGIPVGVISAETRVIQTHVPADPANLQSEEKVIQQAGQVWYPDSSYKTAQAILDFNRERLPLIILANWRGFSGGMKDMYEQNLKFGSYIVDALRKYTQPILVYLPPYSELRGGAWAVLDTLINPRFLEMYADPNARGGVLEPEGTVEVRFKQKDLIKSIHRLDHKIVQAKNDIAISSDTESIELLENAIKERIVTLLPIYHTAAVQFANLHDSPERMLTKQCIKAIVPWDNCRSYLFKRLRRNLQEDKWVRCIEETKIDSNGTYAKAKLILKSCFLDENDETFWENDNTVYDWLIDQQNADSKVLNKIAALKNEAVYQTMFDNFQENPTATCDAMLKLMNDIPAPQRQELMQRINEEKTCIY